MHETCKQPNPVDCDARNWKLKMIEKVDEKWEIKWIKDAVYIQCGILFILFALINRCILRL